MQVFGQNPWKRLKNAGNELIFLGSTVLCRTLLFYPMAVEQKPFFFQLQNLLPSLKELLRQTITTTWWLKYFLKVYTLKTNMELQTLVVCRCLSSSKGDMFRFHVNFQGWLVFRIETKTSCEFIDETSHNGPRHVKCDHNTKDTNNHCGAQGHQNAYMAAPAFSNKVTLGKIQRLCWLRTWAKL